MKPSVTRARYATADGIELVADVGGDVSAPPVILLHGGGQTRNSWSGAMRALIGAGYHVINYDARGHGESGWSPDGRYPLAAFAQDLGIIMASLPRPAAIVGASLGGAAAMRVLRDGSRPAAIALVDVVPKVDPRGVDRIHTFMLGNPNGFATLDEAADAVTAYNPHRPKPSGTSGLARNLRLKPDGRYYWHWDPRLLSGDHERNLAEFESLTEGVRQAVDVPILLVRGLQSDVVSEEGVAALKAAAPRLEVCDVSDAGHMVAGDKNDAFNRGILEFLGRTLPLG